MESGLKDVCLERVRKAHIMLDDAEFNFSGGRLFSASNRAYYAVFHAMRAVNALEEFDSSKHSGVMAYFTRNFLKSERLSKALSDNIRDNMEMRERSDYEDFFEPDRDEVADQLKAAEEFVSAVDEFLNGFFAEN